MNKTKTKIKKQLVKTEKGHRKESYAHLFLCGLGLIGIVVLALFVPGHVQRVSYPLEPTFDADLHSNGEVQMPPLKKGAWSITKPALHHEIEGYANGASYMPGGKVDLQVSCTSGSFTALIYRMGYYQNNGARLAGHIKRTSCHKQNITRAERNTGLVNMHWSQSYSFNLPRNWPSGYYLVKLTDSHGYQSYIPLLLRSLTVKSKYLFIHASATEAAYNSWGNNSLYTGNQTRYHRAFEVSFDRPLLANDGAGEFLNWEYPMAMFLEKNGYQVDYASDLDVNANPSILLKYKAIIITGHDEYWSWRMLSGYQKAVDKGVNLAIFGANTGYRPARIQSDPITHHLYRVVVDYKQYNFDPMYWADLFNGTIGLIQPGQEGVVKPTALTSVSWRGYPFYRPESQVIGELFEGTNAIDANMGIANTPDWMFSGSGLTTDSVVPNLVGYEYDRYYPSSPQPAGVTVVFKSYVPKGYQAVGKVTDVDRVGDDEADGVYYSVAGGGQVFNAGTIDWAWALDPSLSRYYSPGISIVTGNILDRFGQ